MSNQVHHWFVHFIFQAHLDIEVPSYFAANDPLLTYATPLHSNEEHTTTREELIGKCKQSADFTKKNPISYFYLNNHLSIIGKTKLNNEANEDANGDEESSKDSHASDVKSWSLDHAYLPNDSTSSSKKSKGKLVKSKKLDYKNIMWPRDALYISYKDEKFEYVNDLEANDEPVYYWWVKKCTSIHVYFEIKFFL